MITLLLLLQLHIAPSRCIDDCFADIHVIRHGVKHDTPALPTPRSDYRRPRSSPLTPAQRHRRWFKDMGLIQRISRLC